VVGKEDIDFRGGYTALTGEVPIVCSL
jgi:hypothetical protein